MFLKPLDLKLLLTRSAQACKLKSNNEMNNNYQTIDKTRLRDLDWLVESEGLILNDSISRRICPPHLLVRVLVRGFLQDPRDGKLIFRENSLFLRTINNS